jgi:general secretion pathway protein D
VTVEQIAPDAGQINPNFVEPWNPANPPSNVRVNIDFSQAELSDVVMWISALTGRNFIIADTISSSKKITIISPKPVTIGDAYRAFQAALRMNGLTTIPFGNFLKIVEAESAGREPLKPSSNRSDIPSDDQMVTHIVQLEHVAISTVQPVIDAMKSPQAQIVPYEPTGTLIITENGLNLKRLLGILDLLDVPGGQEQINMYQVQYSDAEQLKSTLLEIF